VSKELASRLREHATNLSVDREVGREETDALPEPSQLEADLNAAALYIEGSNGSHSDLTAEIGRLQSLLFEAVEELTKYRSWADKVEYAVGARPK